MYRVRETPEVRTRVEPPYQKETITWRIGQIIWLCNTKLRISVQVTTAFVLHMTVVICGLHRVVSTVNSDVSEEPTASIFRVI